MVVTALIFGSFLAFAIGAVHSYLGERYILIRLLRRDNLPRLFGSDWFTKRTLRFAWHVTTVASWGFGGILLSTAIARESSHAPMLWIIAGTFLVCAFLAAGFTRGRHLSWIVFLAIAALSAYGAMN